MRFLAQTFSLFVPKGPLNHQNFQQDEATQVTVPEGATAGSVMAIELPETPPESPKAGFGESMVW